MLDPSTRVDSSLSLEAARRIDAACDRFEAVWLSGERPRAEDYLADLSAAPASALLAELLGLELYYRRKAGESPSEADYRTRFPAHADAVVAAFRKHDSVRGPATSPEIPGYELLEVLGKGGMGIVYQARQKSLNRVVALKLLPGSASAGGQLAARFRIEAEAAGRLRHPNIVQVYDAGEYNGVPYYAMEYVTGPTLAQVLRAGPLPPRQAAECLEQVARAVHYAHMSAVLHRDLKPANVLFAACGVALAPGDASATPQAASIPKITDFGLAKALDAGAELTLAGQIVGTPTYMAPEQALGIGAVGPASDVYSLGAVLYAALTGQPPFRGDSVYSTLSQVAQADPLPPRRLRPEVPHDLETVCLKCLQKDPAQRYASAQEVADDLRRWLDGETPRARRANVLVQMARRNRLAAALFVLLLLALTGWLATLALWWTSHDRGPPGNSSSPDSTRRASSIRPAVRWVYASSTPSHSSGVNGTASPGAGAWGTSRRTMASHNSGRPAPVRAETWTAPTARLRSQVGARSILLTTGRTRSGGTSGHTGSALASRTHRHKSADAAALRARSMPCPSSAAAS
jgi:eukaryotic-like serine/threonine-protein kinase